MPFGMNWNQIGQTPQPSQPTYGQNLSNSIVAGGEDIANRGLYDNMDQIRQLLNPLFQGQRSAYSGQLNSQVEGAGRNAAAQAAFLGVNPASFQASAEGRTRQQGLGGYEDLLNQQQGATIDATGQANQFSREGQQQRIMALLQMLGYDTQRYLGEQQGGGDFEKILGAIIQGGAHVGAAIATGGASVPASVATTAASDRRLKKNIKRIGEYHGLPTYEFEYIWSPQKYIGVMADEVREVMPEAVMNVFGYDVVNYGMI